MSYQPEIIVGYFWRPFLTLRKLPKSKISSSLKLGRPGLGSCVAKCVSHLRSLSFLIFFVQSYFLLQVAQPTFRQTAV